MEWLSLHVEWMKVLLQINDSLDALFRDKVVVVNFQHLTSLINLLAPQFWTLWSRFYWQKACRRFVLQRSRNFKGFCHHRYEKSVKTFTDFLDFVLTLFLFTFSGKDYIFVIILEPLFFIYCLVEVYSRLRNMKLWAFSFLKIAILNCGSEWIITTLRWSIMWS